MKKVPLTWKNRACLGSCPSPAEGTFPVKNSARSTRGTVSADGRGLVSQAGAVLLWETLRVTGLGRGLSQGLARWRSPRAVHDPGKVIADLAAAVALGGDCLAGMAVLRDQPALAGPVASDPVVSRLVSSLARDADAALAGIRGARGRGPGAGWGAGGGRRPGIWRRPGRGRPGRHRGGRALAQGAGRGDVEADVRVPPDDRLGRPRPGRQRGTPRRHAPPAQRRV